MNLFCYSADLSCACSYWRLLGPYSAISNGAHRHVDSDGPVSVTFSNSPPTDVQLFTHDAFIYSRPADKRCAEAMKQATLLGKPSIVDWDDLWWKVPPYSPAYEGVLKSFDAMDICCAYATGFTVTTVALAVEFTHRYTERAQVIPNAWDSRIHIQTTAPLKPRFIVIRGSTTHIRDIDLYRSEIEECREADYEFLWLGYRPHWADMDSYVPWTSPLRYFHNLSHIHPLAVFQPIEDTPFNRAKSGICYLEAYAMDARCICPVKLGEYEPHKPGTLLETVAAGLEIPRKHPILSDANSTRLEFIRSLQST